MKNFFKILMGAIIALIFVSEVPAQIRRGNERVVELSPSEAQDMWNAFKHMKISGDYAMGFTITHSPRHGDNEEYVGEIFGGERNGDTVTRIRVKKAGDKSAKVSDFILVNSPRNSSVWKVENGKFSLLDKSEWLKPMVEGLIFSPFDILMPYINWRHKYAGAGRIGQAVYFFDLSPDNDIGDKISNVKIAVTREFNSPAQTQIFDAKGGILKTVTLGSVKKTDGLWIVLELSARDEASRDKDKLRFRAAKLNTVIDSAVFDTARKPVEPPRLEMRPL